MTPNYNAVSRLTEFFAHAGQFVVLCGPAEAAPVDLSGDSLVVHDVHETLSTVREEDTMIIKVPGDSHAFPASNACLTAALSAWRSWC